MAREVPPPRPTCNTKGFRGTSGDGYVVVQGTAAVVSPWGFQAGYQLSEDGDGAPLVDARGMHAPPNGPRGVTAM